MFSGDHQYDLYFAGSDSEEIWRVLEPIMAASPIPCTRAELYDGSEDVNPTVLKP